MGSFRTRSDEDIRIDPPETDVVIIRVRISLVVVVCFLSYLFLCTRFSLEKE